MSTTLMLSLIGAYGCIVAAAAWERNWPRVLYFLSAMGISVAVLWMQNDTQKNIPTKPSDSLTCVAECSTLHT